jgi:hypothetical protein
MHLTATATGATEAQRRQHELCEVPNPVQPFILQQTAMRLLEDMRLMLRANPALPSVDSADAAHGST